MSGPIGIQGPPAASVVARATGPSASRIAYVARTYKVGVWGHSQVMGYSSVPNSVAGFRPAMQSALAAIRGDVDFVGPNHTFFDLDATYLAQYDGAPGITMRSWYHTGFSGQPIEYLTANIATILAAGVPDLIIIGPASVINITTGDTAPTILTKYGALLNAIKANAPNAIVLVSTEPVVQPGSTSGGNAAAWNAISVAVNAGLPAVVAGRGANVVLIDPVSALTPSDYNSDGIHLRDGGYAKLGAFYARAIHDALGQASGLLVPRPFKQCVPAASMKVATAGTDFLQVTAEPGFSFTNGDFAVVLDYTPTSILLDDTNNSIFQLPKFDTGIGIFQKNAGLSVFMAGTVSIPVAVVATGYVPPAATSNHCLVSGKTYQIGLIGNRTLGLIGLFLNGAPIAIASGALVPAWNVAANPNAFLGFAGAVNGAIGSYANLRFAKGAAGTLPDCRSKLARDMLEACYYDRAPLIGESAYYPLDEGTGTTPANAVFGAASGAISGTGGWLAKAATLKPWEFGF